MKKQSRRLLHAVKMAGLVGLTAMYFSSVGLAQTSEVIVDNRDENTRQSGYWWPSNGANPFRGESIYSQDRGGSFTWYPVLPEPGDYEVYAWWTYHENRSSRVPFRVNQDGGAVEVLVNMHDQTLAGQWNLIGRFTFPAGSVPEISVSGENGQANADAVRFVLVDDNIPVPKLKVIDVEHTWGYNLSPGATLTLTATCPLGTLLTGGGVRQRVFPDPPVPSNVFDYFIGSHGSGNKWIATFYNPSDPVINIGVTVTAHCASLELP